MLYPAYLPEYGLNVVSSMLRKFIARSVNTAAERMFTAPVMSTGANWSTLPVSFTCAREFAADERPVTVPPRPTICAEKFGWIEKSEKFALPSVITTDRICIGIDCCCCARRGAG